MTASRLFLLPRRRASWQPVTGSVATIALGLLLGFGGTAGGVLELLAAERGDTVPQGPVWWATAIMGVLFLLLGLAQIAVGARELTLTIRYRRERARHPDWQALGNRRFDTDGATPEGADGLLNLFGAGLCGLMSAPLNLIVVAATTESAGYAPGLPEIGMSYTGLAIMAVPFALVLNVAVVALAWSGLAAVAQDAKPRRGLFLAFNRFPLRMGQPLRASLAVPSPMREQVRRMTVRLMGGTLAGLVQQLRRRADVDADASAKSADADRSSDAEPTTDNEQVGTTTADPDASARDRADESEPDDADVFDPDIEPGDADLIDLHTDNAYRHTVVIDVPAEPDSARDLPIDLTPPRDAPAGDWFLSVILHGPDDASTAETPESKPPLVRALFRLPIVPS